jgi:hypothetical protein
MVVIGSQAASGKGTAVMGSQTASNGGGGGVAVIGSPTALKGGNGGDLQ